MLTLPEVCRDAAESADGKFNFPSADEAAGALARLGWTINIPDALRDRPAALYRTETGRVSIDVERRRTDEHPRGWYGRTKTIWTQYTDAASDQRTEEEHRAELDKLVRSKVVDDCDEGWGVKTKRGTWKHTRERDSARAILRHAGHAPDAAERMLARAYHDDWQVVCEPFAPEDLPMRRWNLRAPQYRFQPSRDHGPHANWDRILHHCGQSLDSILPTHPWAIRHGVRTGGDYLLRWLAFVLRQPADRLPYLFFHGPQNSGKSSYHEAAKLLMTRGVRRVDRALKNASGFNGECENTVIAVIEETDLSDESGTAASRVKDWTTGLTLSIRSLFHDERMTKNFLHFVQCANEQSYCPIPSGDTRIVSLYVPMPKREIPKSDLMAMLEREAPSFMRTILDIQLPAPEGRLALPTIDTPEKLEAIHDSDPLAEFIDECCERSGDIDREPLFEAWKVWCKEQQAKPGTLARFSRKLRVSHNIVTRRRSRAEKQRKYYDGITLKVTA